jgi:hypothetical protein
MGRLEKESTGVFPVSLLSLFPKTLCQSATGYFSKMSCRISKQIWLHNVMKTFWPSSYYFNFRRSVQNENIRLVSPQQLLFKNIQYSYESTVLHFSVRRNLFFPGMLIFSNMALHRKLFNAYGHIFIIFEESRYT